MTNLVPVKGDFSRLTFDPHKHYAGVLLQQGRVQLDSDWNEQTEIAAYLRRTLVSDLIGDCGAPAHGGGFAVGVTADAQLVITPGRLYVEGLLCELEAETTYSRQPYLPKPPAIEPRDGRTDLFFLDVWERHVTALEDPALRDPALGGADTSTRLQTVWQVRAVPDVGSRRCDDPWGGSPPEQSEGTLRVHAKEYRGPENQLYRVEIHAGGAAPRATFKWSRDNASTAVAIGDLVIADALARVTVEPPGSALAFTVGDVVEVGGEHTELQLCPGTLARVVEVDAKGNSMAIEGDLDRHSGEPRLKARRWDGPAQALPLDGGEAELEDGIRVTFSSGRYATGDYWLIPARPDSQAVDWPEDAPARGIRHHYCPLALVHWGRAKDQWSSGVTDCRRIFGVSSERPSDCAGCREELAHLRAVVEAQGKTLERLKRSLTR